MEAGESAGRGPALLGAVFWVLALLVVAAIGYAFWVVIRNWSFISV